MLTKLFTQVFRPAVPEVPYVAAHTVCEPQPAPGHWAWVCTDYPLPEGDTGTSLPPGATLVYDTAGHLTGYRVCASTWVADGVPAEPVCTTYPEQAHVAAQAAYSEAVSNDGWNAGANSVDSQAGGCELAWTQGEVVGEVLGITSDLEDVSDYTRISHGFYFTHAVGGGPRFRVMESGAARTAEAAYVPGDTFKVLRVGGSVTYWHNDVQVHASSVVSTGTVNAGVSLYASGDQAP